MRNLFTLLFVFTFATMYLHAQTGRAKQKIIQQTNVEYLQKFAEEAKTRFESNKQKALKLAQEKGWVIREEKDGKLRELVGVTDKGTPLYYETSNVDAANSTRANTLHNGGSLGLNIEGQGMTAHVWDGGLARTTHQEYDGIGGSNRFSIGDGTTTLHYHSAHVTGTIIASGFDPDAKGMAPQASAVGYEWNNDVSEATTAAAGGMLVSNHSYGYGADAIPDAWFGQYGSDAVDWDGLMYSAPYYLMLVAAGNDGDDETSNAAPLDGNAAYDKLNGHATAKNNLVVANAQDAVIEGGELVSVLINSSSSEGPTDDYRIKPDITGNGTQLYSTYEDADDAYGTISGTSMATPNVTGTLLLLQQYYNDLNGGFMRAATLKGLALHTADDAGAVGPDAVFGWGLMNGKAAAEAITNNGLESIIEERTLANGGSYSFDVVANGIDDLVASISWTDPAGTANSGTNSSTPALVNDLDIRITKSATVYYPWKLTGLTSNTEGDNTVDPYEKIIIDNAVCGDTYTITINHKGTLSASQNYSLIVTGIKEASLDAGIVDVSPSVSSCEYSNNTPIDITVANQGGSTVSNIDVAYEVRKADNTLVGNGTYTIASIAACNTNVNTVYSDMSENGETYTVTVSIVLAGDENSANNTYMGSFTPMNVDLTVPGSVYSTSFEAGSLAEIGWSYEDLNGDGGQAVWYIYTDAGFANTGSGFAIQFAGAGDLQSDDWMFSPCLYLKAGQTYEVSYYSMEFQDKAESIALYLGTDATSTSMLTLLEAAYDPATSWTQRTPGSFTVPSDGVYYLGWHSYNMTDSYAPAIDDVTITNTSAATLPQVTTDVVTNIGATSADGGGNVTEGGSSAVTARGIVYGSSINPTLSDNVLTAGTAGTGTYSGLTMSGLTPGSVYYVRAYATNSSGTVYGANQSFTTLTSMNFVSSTAVQNNSNIVNQGATDQDILEIQIEMDGALSPFSATSFTLSTNGSTDAANDLTSAKLYYTGTSGTFATGTQFGSATSNPDGSFTITGTQELVDGVNYFWLAYDISAGAGDGNTIDAECTSITVGSVRTPDVTAPAGNRTVYVDPCATPVAVFPFTEGFEAGDVSSCWTYEGTAWTYQAGGEGGNPATAHTGSYNALFYHASSTADVSKLVTPPLDLSGATSASLSFWHTQPNWSGDQDELRIYYKTSAVGSWVLLDAYTGDIPDWTKETISLPNTTGEYYIAFEATGAYGYGVGLDDIEILNSTPTMTYVSSTTTQLNTDDVYRGENDVEIIGVQIVTSNEVTPLDATSFTFNTNGSTSAANDISNAKLYYTGTSGAFNNVNQFGSTVAGPNGSFTITGTQTLVEGTNYFWLAYDINSLASASDVVDAECNSITVGSVETPTVQAPTGSRTIIIDPCGTPVSSFPYTNDFVGNALPSCWENIDNDGSGQIWEFDNPGGRAFASTTSGNGFAILDSDNYGSGGTQNADMISSTFDFTNYTSITLSFEHYFYYWSGSSATLSYSIDGGTTWTEISSWATTSVGSLATPAVFTQDLTAQLEGESNVKFKWNYTGDWGYYWAVDDIEVDAVLAGTLYTVTFDVSDAGDSSPLDGAEILINSSTLTTDINGEATIDLIDGSYPYTASKAGYDNATGTVVVSGSVVTESVSLNETTYTLTFAVVDEASQPVENASVTINSTTLTTDVNGEAIIDLVNGTYAYTVSKAGYDNGSGSVTIAGTAVTEDVTLILTTYTVTFDVTDSGDSHPLDGASISINSTTLTTDINGEATIDLVDGSYPYTVTKAGYDNATGTVVVSGSTVTESVSMDETTYTLTFAVVDEASQPIENASVSINSTTITTDVNGEATIDLVNGTYAYTVSKTGYDNATGSAIISGSAATEDVTLILTTYTVTFTVTDAGDSHALDGASISINSTTLNTDVNGQATIDLADGTYAYTVTRTDYDEVTGSVTVSGATVSENVSMNLTTYTLTFAVVDEASQPVENASIDINSSTLTTDVNGEATIDLPNGTYSYTVTKAGFADNSGTATITGFDLTKNVTLVVPTYTITFTVTDAGDSHAIDGASIDINSSTLTTNLSGQVTIDLENGTYAYTITKAGYEDASGSVTIADAAVAENVTMTAYAEITFNTDITNVTCNGGADGDITFTNVAGGSGTGFEYSIDGGSTWQISSIYSGLVANSYSVQVKDDAGNFSAVSFVSVTEPDAVTFNVNPTNVSTYGGNDGAIEFIDVAGGTSPYQYSIDGGSTWSSSNPIIGLVANTYTAQVRDVNQCASTQSSVTITQPAEPQYTVTFNVTDAGDAHVIENASISINSTTLTTDVNGQATIDLVDGDYPYMVTNTGYDNASGTITVSGGAVTENVVIYKSNNLLTFVVVDESANAVGGASISINSTTLTTDASGEATITLPNGTFAYTVSAASYVDANGSVTMAGADVTKNVTLYTTANTVTFNVTDGSNPLAGVSIDINSTTIVTSGSGVATINLPDGTYAYTASITGYDNAAGSVTVSGAAVTENVTMTESAYTVTFTVVDEGSTAVDGATISINSTTLTTDASGQATIDLLNGSYSYAVTKTGLADANGSVTVSGAAVSENVTMYSSAHTITFTITNADGGAAIEGASVAINSSTLLTNASGIATINLPDGTYAYSVAKDGYESASGSVTVSGADVTENVSLNAIAYISFSFNVTDIFCYGSTDGIIEFTNVTGGSGSGYEYSINGGASWQTNPVVSGLSAGTFTAMVKDDAGNMSASQDVTITQPAQITGFVVDTENVSTYGGNDGSIKISGVTGGSGSYEYSIDGGITFQTSNLFENLVAGNYDIFLRDSYGCGVEVGTVTITQPALDEYTVTFEVMVDNHVYEGATIVVNSTTLTTDVDGLATIDLPDGSYDYTASVNGYNDITGTVVVAGAAVTETISFVGINEAFASQISIYPNPVSTTLNIDLEGTYTVTLVNSIGNVIHTQKMESKASLEVDKYADGLYLLRIEQNGYTITKPVIIKK